MRIVAGKHRGRVLQSPEGRDVRPTSDRAREALFNILEHGAFAARGSPVANAHVLDVFAGTGALGLEALSRGAAGVTFIEQSPAALRANIALLKEQGRASVLAIDARRPPPIQTSPARVPATLALLDPPYGKDLGPPTLTALARQGWLAPEAVVVLEIAAAEPFAPPSGFVLGEERRYGAARLVFMSYQP